MFVLSHAFLLAARGLATFIPGLGRLCGAYSPHRTSTPHDDAPTRPSSSLTTREATCLAPRSTSTAEAAARRSPQPLAISGSQTHHIDPEMCDEPTVTAEPPPHQLPDPNTATLSSSKTLAKKLLADRQLVLDPVLNRALATRSVTDGDCGSVELHIRGTVRPPIGLQHVLSLLRRSPILRGSSTLLRKLRLLVLGLNGLLSSCVRRRTSLAETLRLVIPTWFRSILNSRTALFLASVASRLAGAFHI